MTNTFEEKERMFSQELVKVKDLMQTKTNEAIELTKQVKAKETELTTQAEKHKLHMTQIQTLERAQRQKLIMSHKNESRVMASLLHETSAQLSQMN